MNTLVYCIKSKDILQNINNLKLINNLRFLKYFCFTLIHGRAGSHHSIEFLKWELYTKVEDLETYKVKKKS